MRRTRLALLLTASAVLLSGCFKIDMQLEINADDTVDGSMIMALDKEARDSMESMGEGSDDMSFSEEDLAELGPDAEVSPYEDEKFVGEKVTFQGVTVEALNKSFQEDDGEESSDEFELVHEDGQYRFSGQLDMSDLTGEGSSEGAGDEDLEGFEEMAKMMLRDAEMKISVTFPGDIVETNGVVDGKTVSWDLMDTEEPVATLTAVAEEASTTEAVADKVSDATGMPVAALAAGAGVLVLLLVGGALVVRSNRRNAAGPSSDG